MRVDKVLQAFALIDQNIEKSNFEKEPKSEELIQKAEKALGLKFPPTYRLFLKRYGCGGVGSMEVYGIIDDKFNESGVPDGIWLTLKHRNKGAPHHFIIIASAGYGPLYVLDASQSNENGEYPVLLWTPGEPPTPTEKVADDFGEFLLEQVQQALSRQEG
jgi:hypothetical protein